MLGLAFRLSLCTPKKIQYKIKLSKSYSFYMISNLRAFTMDTLLKIQPKFLRTLCSQATDWQLVLGFREMVMWTKQMMSAASSSRPVCYSECGWDYTVTAG